MLRFVLGYHNQYPFVPSFQVFRVQLVSSVKKDNYIAVTSVRKTRHKEDGIFSVRKCFLSCFVSFQCFSGVASFMS